MATTLSQPQVAVSARCNLQSGASPAIIGSQVVQSPTINLSAGSAAGQVDRCFSEAFTVTNGTPLTINMGTALDPLGSAIGMVHVTSVVVENNSITAGQDMTIGGGTHPVLGTDSYTAQANGGVVVVANPNPGYSVVGSSSDILQITVAAGTSVAGKITILGRSA